MTNAHIPYCPTHIVLGVTDWFTTSITADDQCSKRPLANEIGVHEHHGHLYTTISTNATTVYLKGDLCQPSVDKTMHGLHEAA